MRYGNYLFISGILRSGTTLLTRALAANPDIKAAYQPFTPFFKIWRNNFFKQIENKPFDNEQPMGVNYFFSEAQKKEFSRRALEVEFSATDLEEFKNAAIRNLKRDSCERLQNINAYIDKLKPGKVGEMIINLMDVIDRSIPSQHALTIGLKEVWCEEFFSPLLNIPEFKVLHILRDPRAVFASRNTGRYLALCGDFKYPLLFIVRSWRRSYAYWQANKQKKGYEWLCYEDLLLHPEETLERLCNFLDIGYDSAMGNPSCYIDGQGNPWEPNSTSVTTRTFNMSPINYWHKTLDCREIGAIEFLCSHEMEALGYQRKQPNFGVNDFLAFEEDETVITEWLRHPPYILDIEQKELEISRYVKLR